MSYEPNFNDPRIIRRVHRALSFVECFVKHSTPVAQSLLRKHFGHTARDLGHYLLTNLLVVDDPYYNFETHQCKKYSKNAAGIAKIKQLINHTNYQPILSDAAKQQLESGEFEWDEKNDRHYNEIQFIPRIERTKVLNEHGYRYAYDLVSAAATLLLQRARQLNPHLEVPLLTNYCINRSKIRAKVARDCGISIEQVKTVINAIINGGIITTWHQSALFHQLNRNYDAVKKLNAHPLIQELKQDVRDMWTSLKSEFEPRYFINKNGTQVRKRLSTKEKSAYYRKLESQVMKEVIKMFRKKGKVFQVHDGWYTNELIDPQAVKDQIRNITGFVVNIDLVIHEQE